MTPLLLSTDEFSYHFVPSFDLHISFAAIRGILMLIWPKWIHKKIHHDLNFILLQQVVQNVHVPMPKRSAISLCKVAAINLCTVVMELHTKRHALMIYVGQL